MTTVKFLSNLSWLHLLIFIHLTEVSSFPFVNWLSQSFNINTNTDSVLQTSIQSVGTNMFFYTPVMTNNNCTITVYRYNSSTWSPLLIGQFTYIDSLGIISPIVNVLDTQFSITYSNSHSLFYRLLVNKNTMTLTTTITSSTPADGIYVLKWNLYFYWNWNGQQGILLGIDTGTLTLMSSYVTATAFPQKIGYLFNTNQTIMYSFYLDLNIIVERSLTSTPQIQMDYSSPTVHTMMEFGYQCFCLNSDSTLLYVLYPSKNLTIIDTLTFSIKSTKITSYTGISKCYYDNGTYGLVFFNQTYNSGSTAGTANFYLYYLINNTASFPWAVSQSNLVIDSTFRFFTLAASNQFSVYNMTNGVCSTTGTFYDPTTKLCLLCSTGCTSCSSASFCTVCMTGYTLTNQTCVSNNATNVTANSTSSTIPTNTTNATAANATAANSTANATTNSSNMSTNSTNQTSLQLYLIDNGLFKLLNKVPGNRKILSLIFYYFINIDDLWLYQYHERDYGYTMNQLFVTIRTLQKQKWQILNLDAIQTIYDNLLIQQQDLMKICDQKKNYSMPKFVLLQQNGQNFFSSCFYYLTINVSCALVIFLLLKIGFRLFFNFKISILLRPFSFWLYLAPLLLQGNIQYFFFLMFSQSYLGFYLTQSDKNITILCYLVFFILISYVVCSYFIYYSLYKKLAKYFFDNWRCKIQGLFTLLLSYSLRHLLMGVVHNIVRQNYRIQLLLLFFIEVCFVIICFVVMKMWNCQRTKSRFWFPLLFAFLRMTLQLVLFFQQTEQGIKQQLLFQKSIQLIINVYLYLYLFAIISEVIRFIQQILKWNTFKQKQRTKKMLLSKKGGMLSCKVAINDLNRQLIVFQRKQREISQLIDDDQNKIRLTKRIKKVEIK